MYTFSALYVHTICIKMAARLQGKSPKLLGNIVHNISLCRRRNSVLLRRYIPRLRFDLFQSTAAARTATAASIGVDTFRMATICLVTSHAGPNILVVDLIRMFCCNIDPSAIDGVISQGFFAFESPLLEACAVGLVADIGDHVIGKVTVFVGKGIDQAIFVVDDALG